MPAGAIAQLLPNRSGPGIHWTMTLVAGCGGSFVGGMLFCLIAGDDLELRFSGLLGSIIITGNW